jgi:hypothetical protein
MGVEGENGMNLSSSLTWETTNIVICQNQIPVEIVRQIAFGGS